MIVIEVINAVGGNLLAAKCILINRLEGRLLPLEDKKSKYKEATVQLNIFILEH